MGLSMSIIDNNHKLDRMLESTNLAEYLVLLASETNEYELIEFPKYQPGDLLHEYTGVRIIRVSESSGLKGVQRNCIQELILARDLLCLPPPLWENKLEIASMQLGSGRGMVT